jgi:hypothetical protein
VMTPAQAARAHGKPLPSRVSARPQGHIYGFSMCTGMRALVICLGVEGLIRQRSILIGVPYCILHSVRRYY